jgi:ABC-type proline/glycine betaine transport system permease subunit
LQWLPQLLDRLPDKLIESAFGPGMAKINEMKRVSLDTSEYYLFTHVS